ncbi:MAG: YicC/YloC family endoribonuclease [Candidatus Neomarinimicrobiota bacterium]
MIKSMTGYGRANLESNGGQIIITIRSVNSRYLDLKIRGIDLEPDLEFKIREAVRKKSSRGSIIVSIKSKTQDLKNSLEFDKEKFEEIEATLLTIQREYGRHLDLGDLLSAGDLFRTKDNGLLEDTNILTGVSEALEQLDTMQIAEGSAIYDDLNTRIKGILNSLGGLNQQAKKSLQDRKSKYKEKINDLVGSIEINQDRIIQEIAMLAEKYDFTEEAVRCESHCRQFNEILEQDEPVGKRLNFLLQEMVREVNTIGSKSNDGTISKIVVELKSEIEKCREQIQNIE